MSNFIVLGLIPGTNIELTFNTWLAALTLVGVLLSLRRVRTYITVLQIAFAIQRPAYAPVEQRGRL